MTPFKYTPEMEEAIRTRVPVEGLEPLAGEIGVSRDTLRYKAKRMGVSIYLRPHDWCKGRTQASRDLTALNSETVNARYFDQWSVNVAYVVGYIYADGSLRCSPKGYKLNFCCEASDRDVVESILEDMKSKHKLLEIPERINPRDGYVRKASVHCGVSNSHLVHVLTRKYGLLENKSNLDTPLPDVPPALFPHFCRGYHVGDGHVPTVNSKEGPNVWFMGTHQFIRQLQAKICETVDIPANTVSYDGPKARITWSAKSHIEKLYYWMFPPGDYLYGRRKRQDFTRMMESLQHVRAMK